VRTFLVGILLSLYHLYIDLFIGNILTAYYTVTDLNKPDPVFDDDCVEEEAPVIEEKDFELTDFEYFYYVLRF
jgi:hypothetical protein